MRYQVILPKSVQKELDRLIEAAAHSPRQTFFAVIRIASSSSQRL
jgi:hypothetical protein